MNKLTETYCDVGDKVNAEGRENTLGYFCKLFIPQWEEILIENGTRKRRREKRMSSSEIMTVIISFLQSNCRDFENYYLGYVSKHVKSYFPF